ncbi:Uncharacterized protein Forpe1208_v003044 [Fusarium oxysporum f. sp. rapae]|uniref:Zn(2)-C6 fungal-type domain-containing protein n=1 Tax=Fusarium oxysporum f. sp. rapae TaxID=485398 RepID=A0A8J5PIL9_FUSOX|nr:Uncharacterized protein Forpe1208_v003044 [Fusarium oxysporum f. sp. rapae]
MVGVPRSTGCRLCRTRKVKCDTLKPSCGNCIKYGAECPGYSRGLKFVDEKHQIRQRGRRQGKGEEVSTSSSSSTTGSDITTSDSETWSLVRPSPTLLRLELPRGPLLLNMIESSTNYTRSTDVFILLSWLNIDRLGKRALLDGAICSFALHLTGKANSNADLVAKSRSIYGLALNELQAALQHSTEWKASETLCAAILLCYFELFAGTTVPDTWIQHAKGIGTLMEQRGPAAHAEGWDAAMLLSCRGILTISDMFYPGKDQLFLSRPAWRHVTSDGGRRLIYAPDAPIEHIRVGDGFLANLAKLTPILHGAYLLREANKAGIFVEPDKISALAHLATVEHARLARWFDDFDALEFPRPVEVMSTDPANSLFETVLEHKSAAAGSLLMGYWASMLILEETLVECGTPRANSEISIRYFVNQILRSVESVGRGTMGPYRIGFAIRIVYEFATGQEQRWIASMLDRFSQGYAAIDKKTYPKPKDDDTQPTRFVQSAA